MAKAKILIFMILLLQISRPAFSKDKFVEEFDVFSIEDKKIEILRLCKNENESRLLTEVNELFVILSQPDIDAVLEDLKYRSTIRHDSNTREICHAQLDWSFDEMKKKYRLLEYGSIRTYTTR